MGIRRRVGFDSKAISGCFTIILIFAVCLLSMILLTAEFDNARCHILGDQNACNHQYQADNKFSPK